MSSTSLEIFGAFRQFSGPMRFFFLLQDLATKQPAPFLPHNSARTKAEECRSCFVPPDHLGTIWPHKMLGPWSGAVTTAVPCFSLVATHGSKTTLRKATSLARYISIQTHKNQFVFTISSTLPIHYFISLSPY